MGWAIVSSACAALADVAPKRIVSLNLCTDQLLVELARPERIVAVSELGADKQMSAEAKRLSGFRSVRASAEDVLALAPDLVLTADWSSPATIALLRRLGLNIVTVPLASDFDGMFATIRQIAHAIGEDARGEQLIEKAARRLAAVRRSDNIKPTALTYETNGVTSSKYTLLDKIIEAAGYHNAARDRTLGPGDRYPLELMVANPPDLIVFANAPDDFKTVLADNLRHPALLALLRQRPSVDIPLRLSLCAVPASIDAVELIASKRSSGFAEAAGH